MSAQGGPAHHADGRLVSDVVVSGEMEFRRTGEKRVKPRLPDRGEAGVRGHGEGPNPGLGGNHRHSDGCGALEL